jgi:hypothetical protein
MAAKKKQKREEEKGELVVKIVDMLRREVDETLGPDATYEQRRDLEAELMRKVLWKREEDDLKSSATDADEVEFDGTRYRRMRQPSSATYHGRWGSHTVEEPLYREVGVRNGPTIKPLELRVGIVAKRLTPDLARIAGELYADDNSRRLEQILTAVGMRPPSRAVLEKRLNLVAQEVAERAEELEAASRTATRISAEVASVSCGLDRFAVRMAEPAAEDTLDTRPRPRRTTPYVRAVPPAKDHHWRMAWVGTVSTYDCDGKQLDTWCYTAESGADPIALARRAAQDVLCVLEKHPTAPVHVVQDGAPELRALPKVLAEMVPASATIRTLIDFEHLAGYLDEVVNACEPEGDPCNMTSWYRGELLRDDAAIDRIHRSLRDRAKRLPGRNTPERKSVAAALSYIRERKHLMRYASHHAANLTIGSGATEGTCWSMQQRVKRRGQSWETPGVRGTLAVRALVKSERWHAAWQSYAASHRGVIRPSA